jgi:hypothetical protein
MNRATASSLRDTPDRARIAARGYRIPMTSHHEEPPVEVEGDFTSEEDMDAVDPTDELDLDPDEKPNYTDRHPEHFRNPPGHVREFREEGPDSDGAGDAIDPAR